MPAYSGNFSAPYDASKSQKQTDEFNLPLDNPDMKQQVVGEGNRLFMPGRLRKYIPTLYKQVWTNTRAILSINGFEIVSGQDVESVNEQGTKVTNANTQVTSDIRNTLIRDKDQQTPIDGDTVALKAVDGAVPRENGMLKLVISEGPHDDGSARQLNCGSGSKFMVHDGETYDTYTFTEIGGHIEYLQTFAVENDKLPGVKQGETIYLVTQYEGFFSNKTEANKDPLPASLGVTMPAAPADDAAADDAAADDAAADDAAAA